MLILAIFTFHIVNLKHLRLDKNLCGIVKFTFHIVNLKLDSIEEMENIDLHLHSI